jgi:NADP-dependent 3-hydroxy acid dehydrogenase YdfG
MTKKAIVTGASSGIGYEIARQLLAKDWQVIGVSRHAQKDNTPTGTIVLKADLLADDAPQTIMAFAQKELGGLDLLVNNAGGSWVGNLESMPDADLDRVMNLNVRSLMRMCRAAIPLLKESAKGQIINVSSIAAHLPMETLAVYCASKAAMLMFSKVLAKELSPEKIRVNVLSPTGTDTNLFETVGVKIDKNTLISSEDVARTALFLTELPGDVEVVELLTHKRFSV